MLTTFSYLAYFSVDFFHVFNIWKYIRLALLKQQQIYDSVNLSRSRSSAILAQFSFFFFFFFFLIHILYGYMGIW